MVKSYVVGWWWVAHEILLSALGLGVVSILYSLFDSQVPGPSPSRLTITLFFDTHTGWSPGLSPPLTTL